MGKSRNFQFDFYKHLTTLSVAILVILAAFIREIGVDDVPGASVILLVTLWMFVIVIVGSVDNMTRIAKGTKPRKFWLIASDVSFVFGMISLVLSSMPNLFP
jgi:hypothetical protein